MLRTTALPATQAAEAVHPILLQAVANVKTELPSAPATPASAQAPTNIWTIEESAKAAL